MTSTRTWELCVAEMKKRDGKNPDALMFLTGSSLAKVSKCYCTMASKKSASKVKKNARK